VQGFEYLEQEKARGGLTPGGFLKRTEGGTMKARVHVMLKAGVLDPQGEAVRHALGAMGFDKVTGVRQGKVIDLQLAEGATEADVTEMCEKLLANTVIERYDVEFG
jgi:phosphoribosylformylglycinamidine synthase PurS subunit